MDINFKTKCPHCNQDLIASAPVNPISLAPAVRGKLTPVGSIGVYRISSEEIKQFITQKARQYVPDVKIEIVQRYCEKKRRHELEPHHSYASLRIAFSENIVEKSSDFGWWGKIGESGNVGKIQKSMFEEIIQKYSYNRKDIDKWLKSYKSLENLEESFGMTEAYIEDLRTYAIPRNIPASNKENWIIFAADPLNVITDMLTEISTNKVPGKIDIKDVYPVNKDIVEYVVHLLPQEMKLNENPHVRQILLGEEKPKK